ncbi:MAG: hypothetical protein ABR602_04590, partial [Gemmatimonadales bacterium]
MPLAPRSVILLAALSVGLSACASSYSGGAPAGPAPAISMAKEPPNPDPRVGLAAGRYNAAQAFWNLRMLSTTPSPSPFDENTNSDLAFTGNYAIQGNYNGFVIWDISNPSRPRVTLPYLCPASQSDVSV